MFICWSVGVLVALFSLPISPVRAETLKEPVLRGLEGVFVLVEALGPGLQQDGVQRLQVQTQVELRLLEAGIRVLEREQAFERAGIPYLYVNIGSYKDGQGSFAVCIDVSLREQVLLLRKDKSPAVIATTWRKGARVGVLPSRIIQRGIRETIDEAISEFIEEFRKSQGTENS